MYKCILCENEYEKIISLNNHWKRTHKRESEELYKIINNLPVEEIRICKCGCGKNVKFLGIERGYSEYILGHASKIKNNWGHNKKALNNSINKRKKMIEDGSWKPFQAKDTGEHWSKGLTKQTDIRIKNNVNSILNNKEENKKRSNRMKENRLNGIVPNQYGPKHPNWKGGTSPLFACCYSNRKLYKEWKYPILKENNFTCQKCENNFYTDKKINLEVHHDKQAFSEILKLIAKEYNWEENLTTKITKNNSKELQILKNTIANAVAEYHILNKVSGIVLCKNCHKEIHNSYNLE